MDASEIIAQLKAFGSEQTKKTFLRHGAKEPFYGVKVEDLKKIQKKVKKNHELSLELYDSGISDAMYLAGLIADEKKISKAELQKWAETASWYMISDFTVPWVAAESAYGLELGLEWIKSDEEKIASSGWATLSSLVSVKPNSELDIALFSKLIEEVEASIHQAKNRVKQTMNAFLIAVGSYIPELTEKATQAGIRNGKIVVDMGDTACKTPYAPDYIKKVEDKGKSE